MLNTFVLILAPAVATAPEVPLAVPDVPGPSEIRIMREPSVAGPTPAENIWLRPAHKNSDDRMFPDIAVKDMRIEGSTLYVLVKNQGGSSARGPIRVTARAEANGVKSDAPPARLASLGAGESRWVPLEHFKVALAEASRVSAVALAAPPPALDRSGQACNRCTDLDQANNGLTAPSSAIARGRPQ